MRHRHCRDKRLLVKELILAAHRLETLDQLRVRRLARAWRGTARAWQPAHDNHAKNKSVGRIMSFYSGKLKIPAAAGKAGAGACLVFFIPET